MVKERFDSVQMIKKKPTRPWSISLKGKLLTFEIKTQSCYEANQSTTLTENTKHVIATTKEGQLRNCPQLNISDMYFDKLRRHKGEGGGEREKGVFMWFYCSSSA